ncbi:MAG: MlaE family lipid ABC transporter permease subunit [Candidatus Binatia bacterium]
MENIPSPTMQQHAEIRLDADGACRCTGAWTLRYAAHIEQQLAKLSWPKGEQSVWDVSAIQALDTAGAWLLQRTLEQLRQDGWHVELQGLQPKHAELLRMIAEDGAREKSLAAPPTLGWLAQLGRLACDGWRQSVHFLSFVGENSLVFLRVALHPTRLRWNALFYNLQGAGLRAMPIIGLLAFLMGIVIAYQAAVQLRPFGANIFIVDLVGISMVREIAPLVTAIVVAGRSGSAYTAQIGTMQVTEEVAALRTMGIAPLEILVLPRVLALAIALPLLTALADALGVFGGMVIAKNQLEVNFSDFLNRFGEAVSLTHYLVGLAKAPVFAVIIALVACAQGFQVRGSADSVGHYTTTSVVLSIFLVIVADAFFSILFSWFGV